MTNSTPLNNPKPVNRSFIAFGFLASTLATGLVTLTVNVWGASYQTSLSEHAVRADKFIEASEGFDPLIRQYVFALKNNKNIKQSAGKIRENLLLQKSTLTVVKSTLPQDYYPAVDKYLNTLSEADEAIKTSDGVLKSRDFIQQSAHIAEQRDDLYKIVRTRPAIFSNR